MINLLKKLVATAWLTVGVLTAHAATLVVDSFRKLTGARVVLVYSKYYNVDFRDGTCAALFDQCDSSSDFQFGLDTSVAASQALLDQVFIGVYDSHPELTAGCEDVRVCWVLTPTAVDLAMGVVYTQHARNYFYESFDAADYTTLPGGSYAAEDEHFVWALWSLPVSIPEPATLALVTLGLAGSFALRRRRDNEQTRLG